MKLIYDEGREAMQGLMKDAAMLAHAAMHTGGELSHTLLIHGADGNAIYVPRNVDDEASKDLFVKRARLMCIANAADATVFVSEAWVRKAKDLNAGLDLNIRPSEAPDRQEMVILMGESRNGHCQKMLPIERSEDGKFIGFGEAPEMTFHEVQGRFAQFIPPIAPDEQGRERARELLAGMGMICEEQKSRERGLGRGMF